MTSDFRYTRSLLFVFSASILFLILSLLPNLNVRNFRPDALSNDVVFGSHDLSSRSFNSLLTTEPPDDHTCAVGRPCRNGACCGKNGICGYGPTCQDGCTSNCNATSECGQYAAIPGTECPLKTCCSQFGYCGTLESFCEQSQNCQSNCVTHPQPSGSTGKVLDRVIGYYESWSARKDCHKIAPTDLPLDALTHLNYAFAYVDPTSFALTTMDSQTPESLFQEVADVKLYNSKLEVWISVGGWTFFDNNTVTQPVLGNIARSAENRQTFANNVLKFLNQYGYDGIDIDWEYPGAPDRGGQKDDTQNYVELLKQLRQTFDASGRKLGITITAPSSLWYLRWFDVPGMIQYVDWINVMTYDLHGTWDANNPIGNIVQGHTNLTEIAEAFELFWRVNIPPSKLAMGFGFYGRSFQLSDPSCSTPGCAFKGGAEAGPCSDTSGILMYHEIMSLMKQNPDLKPVYDKDAAVKYLVYNTDQWVSFDDADTFKQKVDWANNIGIGGSLIWASDADDDSYSAHSGLLGKDFKHVDVQALQGKKFSNDQTAVAQSLIGQNGQDCYIQTKKGLTCLREDGSDGSGCDATTEVSRGWEKGKCGKGRSNPICCPVKTAPGFGDCIWRGGTHGAKDCNGQCHTGEALVFSSSWGGMPHESGTDEAKCNRGTKAFCCDAGDWSKISDQCYWTKCGDHCPVGRVEVSTRNQRGDFGCHGDSIARYCCRAPNPPLKDCVWRGKAFDCADAKCAKDEVQIDTHPSGNGKFMCSWGRYQVNCCKTVTPPPSNGHYKCGISLCDDEPEWCAEDEDPAGLKRREDGSLEKRGTKELKFVIGGKVQKRKANWPSRSEAFATKWRREKLLPKVLKMVKDWDSDLHDCPDVRIEVEELDMQDSLADINKKLTAALAQVDHPQELQLITTTIQALLDGKMSNRFGNSLTLNGGAIPAAVIDRVFFTNSLPAGVGPVGGNDKKEIREPISRIIQQNGNNLNPDEFIPVDGPVNGMKGRIFGFDNPMNQGKFTDLVQGAANGLVPSAADKIFTYFATLLGVFSYLQTDEYITRRDTIELAIRDEISRAEALDPAMTGAAANYMRMMYQHRRWVEDHAQSWLSDRIDAFENEVVGNGSLDSADSQQILDTLDQFKGKVGDMTITERANKGKGT